VSAFAQSTVTIDGYFDRGYTTVNNNNNAKNTKLVSSSAGTTTVGISGVSDLGGGMKVGFRVNTDWADVGGLTQDTDTTATSTVAGYLGAAGQAGTFANSQNYIELVSATAGTIRLGTPNNDILTNATSVASPSFSTGIGSAYSSSWSIHSGYGTGTSGYGGLVYKSSLGATSGGVRGIRQANTVKYISPSFNGLVVSYSVVPTNSNSGTSTVDTVGMTEIAARYSNGPLTVMYTQLKYTVGDNTAPAIGSLTASSDNTHSLLGASYQVLPVVKLHAGYGGSSSSSSSIANSKSQQYGVTWNATGNVDVMVQKAKVTDNNTTAYNRAMLGWGADYKLSKTTRAYIRWDSLKLNDGGTSTSGDTIKRSAVGISTSF
jgi:predicted porin